MIHEFLGVSRKLSSWEKSIADYTMLDIKQIDSLVFCDPPTENLNLKSYKCARDKALNQLLLDFIEKNSSFMFDGDSSKIDVADSMQKSLYAYGALAALKLNDENSWDLIKSKFKPFVMCTVCKTKVNWNSNGTDEKAVIDLDIENW